MVGWAVRGSAGVATSSGWVYRALHDRGTATGRSDICGRFGTGASCGWLTVSSASVAEGSALLVARIRSRIGWSVSSEGSVRRWHSWRRCVVEWGVAVVGMAAAAERDVEVFSAHPRTGDDMGGVDGAGLDALRCDRVAEIDVLGDVVSG